MTLSDSSTLTANQIPEKSDERAVQESNRFPEEAPSPQALTNRKAIRLLTRMRSVLVTLNRSESPPS